MVRWLYKAAGREWFACQRCHDVIEADDRQGLFERVLLKPLPQTVSERYAPRYEQKARELHETFWAVRAGPPEPWRNPVDVGCNGADEP
jgi:hypothetical protein